MGSPSSSGRLGALVLTGMIALTGACRREATPPPPPAVAWLGEEAVLRPELEAELARVRVESEAEGVQGEDFAALRRAMLDELIDRRLLMAEAARVGIEVSETELAEALRRRGGDVEDDPAHRARVRQQTLVDKLLLREVVARIAIDPEAVRALYDEVKEELRIDEQVRLSHVMVAEREAAEALLRELVGGADFAQVAKEHSLAPEGAAGGDLGFLPRGVLPEDVEEACFKLRRGQLSEVIESPYGFHLCRMVERRDGRLPAFEEVDRRLENELLREAVSRGQDAFVEKLRKKAGVRIVDEVLQLIEAPPSGQAAP